MWFKNYKAKIDQRSSFEEYIPKARNGIARGIQLLVPKTFSFYIWRDKTNIDSYFKFFQLDKLKKRKKILHQTKPNVVVFKKKIIVIVSFKALQMSQLLWLLNCQC